MDAQRPMLPIPSDAAREIAERYGYDQVVIVARRVGQDPAPFGDHLTTWGSSTAHRSVAARVGDFLKHKVMGWKTEETELATYRDALRPFKQFAIDARLARMPDRTPMTVGSSHACRQCTAGDFKRALEAFGPSTDGDVGP